MSLDMYHLANQKQLAHLVLISKHRELITKIYSGRDHGKKIRLKETGVSVEFRRDV